MNQQTINHILGELRALAFCSAVRHLMYHRNLTDAQAIQLVADHCWVSVTTAKSWKYRGVPARQVDKMLELLNTCSPWFRHQLDPREREAQIWLRVDAATLAEVA